jgi:hypothetical protein
MGLPMAFVYKTTIELKLSLLNEEVSPVKEGQAERSFKKRSALENGSPTFS